MIMQEEKHMITTLLYDLGGTLQSIGSTPESRIRFADHLMSRLKDYGMPLDTTVQKLAELLEANAKLYKKHSEITMTELPMDIIWDEYYLKQFHIGRERLAPYVEELSFLYNYEHSVNVRKPRLKETIMELHEMGIRQGVVSNIISTSFVPHIMQEFGIAEYMECIVMSSVTGSRKPDRKNFDIAMEQMGVKPEETGYVGDQVARDVLGARNAGLALAIRLDNPAKYKSDAPYMNLPDAQADYVIKEFYEIPDIIRKVNAQ